MKIQLNDVDNRLVERVCKTTGYTTEIDDEGWIEVDTLLAHLEELEDKCMELEDRVEELEESIREENPDTYFDYSKKVQNLIAVLEKQSNFIKEKGLEEEYGRYEG